MADDIESRDWDEILEECENSDEYNISTKEGAKTHANLDFKFFYKYILGWNAESKMHKDAFEVIQNPPDQPHNKATKLAVMAPRGHSKTTTWTIAQSLWIAYGGGVEDDPAGTQILIVAASSEQASSLLTRIKRTIKRNDALKHLEPDTEFIEKFPEASEIDNDESQWAARGVNLTTDVRIKVKPFTTSIRSKHIDYCFCDDLLSDKNSGRKTKEQEKNIFYEVITPIVENAEGVLQVVGTPQEHDDLMMELVHEKDAYDSYVYQAWYGSGEDKTPLWPYMWTIEQLEYKRDNDIGPSRFAKEYLCQPMSNDEAFFNYEEAIEPNLDIHFEEKHWRCDPRDNSEYDDWRFYAGNDVAIQSGDKNDFNVFIVLGKDPKGRIWLVNLIRDKGLSPDRIVKKWEKLDNKYSFNHGLVEKNAIGEGVWSKMEDTPSFSGRIEPHDTTRKNRPEMLSKLQAALYNNEIILHHHDTLVDELTSFSLRNGKLQGKSHDDCVMALAIAYYALTESNSSSFSASLIGDDGETDITGSYEEILSDESGEDEEGVVTGII